MNAQVHDIAASGDARLPEQCSRLLLAALERGDLDASVALYEPTAVLFKKSGEVMVGHDAIRANNAALIARKPRFDIMSIVTTVNGDETLATTRMEASLESTNRDGSHHSTTIHTLEVLRKQADGAWRYVIDDPYGSMRSNLSKQDLPGSQA
jgi:uncharacterized protein (TIGR02246 family)